MGAKQTGEAKRKRIIADYAMCRNYSEVARKHKVSPNTVKNIVNSKPEFAQMCEQKQQENTQNVLEYMAEQTETKKRLLGKLLQAMEEKADNLDMFTNIKDLATAYGIVLDKELKVLESQQDKHVDPIQIVLTRGKKDDA